jgi:ABC-2 type transport system ATP-binding protein
LTPDPAIRLSRVHKSFSKRHALRGVDLTVERGEFFGLVGPNGSGKTTSLELMQGLMKPSSGVIETLGMTPWPRNRSLARRIGIQPQSPALFELLTVEEQMSTFCRIAGGDLTTIDTLIDALGLNESRKVRHEHLSIGQRQRLSIGCALVARPDLIFLDEPTASLDPEARGQLFDFLASLRDDGRTVVYTTHYVEEVETLCDRVGVVVNGRIVALGTPRDLIDSVGRYKLRSSAIVGLSDEWSSAHGVVALAGSVKGNVLLAKEEDSLRRFALSKGIESPGVLATSFEDAYLHIVAQKGPK